MVYIDIFFENNKIEKYLNDIIDRENKNENNYDFIDSSKNKNIKEYCSFMNKITSISDFNPHLDLEYEIIKYEFLNEEEYLEKNKNLKPFTKLEYLIEGIVVPLKTHLEKFICKSFYFSGNEYLKLYELIFYFLNLKNKIINNDIYINQLNTKYKKKDLFGITYLKPIKNIIPIKKYYSQKEIDDLNKNIGEFKGFNFEIYKCDNLIYLYNKHMDSFLIPTKHESLKEYFSNKNYEFNKNNIEDLQKELKKLNFLETKYEKSAFSIIISYFNSKKDLLNSGFFNILDSNNIHFSRNNLNLILRCIFFALNDERFKEEFKYDGYRILFKLIQNKTKSVQKEVLKLLQESTLLVDLKSINFQILENLISIIFSSSNPSVSNSIDDHFLAMILIKILRFLCEFQNKDFHGIYFKYLNLLEKEKPIKNPKVTSQNTFNDYSKDHYPINLRHKMSSDLNTNFLIRINSRRLNNRISRNSEKIINKEYNLTELEKNYEFFDYDFNEIHSNKSILSTFEFMLEMLNKIIIISSWNNLDYGSESTNVAYYYDIFSVIIEFLIEMIQGTDKIYLNSLLINNEQENDKNIRISKIEIFLQNIKPIILRDETDSYYVYLVRKELIDFICTFIEEKNTPERLRTLITNIFNPKVIFVSLINTMKKLYIKMIISKNSNRKDEFKDVNYRNLEFKSIMGEFFTEKFFDDKEFQKNPEFELANRMYQYIKLQGIDYTNLDEREIINSKNKLKEISDYHQNLNNKEKNNSKFKNIRWKMDPKKFHESFSLEFKEETPEYSITSKEKFEAVTFFEKITKTIMIQTKDELVKAVFTINPITVNLSKNTKSKFLENVGRESSYEKLFSLIEYCDYFYDELNYNYKLTHSNFLMKFCKKVNYFKLEFLAFVINFIINILMLSTFKYKEESTGDTYSSIAIDILALINITFCGFVTIIWFFTKFPLYWEIDSKKLCLKKNISIEKLNFWNKLEILGNIIFLRNEVTAFLWHLIFSIIGVSQRIDNFVFAVEILIIINLSSVLKNIVKSITLRYNQLFVTFFLFLIINYLFGVFAFYFFSEDFITNFIVKDLDMVIL